MKTATVINTEVEVHMKPAFFHIGWMRTGTTFFQGLFSYDSNINLSLKNRFFSYDPYYRQGKDHYKNNILLNHQSAQHRINIDSDENYSMGRFKTLLREKEHKPYNHKSEQVFIQHDIPEMIARMKACAPDAKIFGVIRKQPQWFESVYKHDVYHFGVEQSFEKFYTNPLGTAYQKAADYFSVYQLYADAFSAENIKILLFEDFVKRQGEFVQELSDFLGVDLKLTHQEQLKKNASTNNFFTLLHRYVNRLGESNPENPESNLYDTVRKGIHKMDRLFTALNLTPDIKLMSEQSRQDIQQQYKQSNKQLASALHLETKMKAYGYF